MKKCLIYSVVTIATTLMGTTVHAKKTNWPAIGPRPIRRARQRIVHTRPLGLSRYGTSRHTIRREIEQAAREQRQRKWKQYERQHEIRRKAAVERASEDLMGYAIGLALGGLLLAFRCESWPGRILTVTICLCLAGALYSHSEQAHRLSRNLPVTQKIERASVSGVQ